MIAGMISSKKLNQILMNYLSEEEKWIFLLFLSHSLISQYKKIFFYYENIKQMTAAENPG